MPQIVFSCEIVLVVGGAKSVLKCTQSYVTVVEDGVSLSVCTALLATAYYQCALYCMLCCQFCAGALSTFV